MSSKPCGMAIIINNKEFTDGMNNRDGTNKDAERLCKLFEWLGFSTKRHDNLMGEEMRSSLQALARHDHAQYDAVVVCVLTHGNNGELCGTDGDTTAIETITGYFNGKNCPTLVSKPKVFIIQACRGGMYDYGVKYEPTCTEEKLKEEMEQQFDHVVDKALDDDERDGEGYSDKSLPSEADFVLAYSTVPGFVSWRDKEEGSWFIQAFVDTMFEKADKDHFMDILTEVNRQVAFNFQTKGRNKQIPAPVTTLTHKLYFAPTGDK